MDIYFILLFIAFLVHYLGGRICIYEFLPFVFKYGIEIMEFNLEKAIILNYSEKIGKIYKKKYCKIKVISQNEFHIVPEYHPYIRRFAPYYINKCININGEYKIISKIPITFLSYPIMCFVIYLITKEITIEIKIMLFLFIFFLIVTFIINKWIMDFILIDIKEYINGIEL
jgi:hypothetical protein